MSPYAERRADHSQEQPVDPSTAGDGLSIKEAARFLGVPGPTLRSWERRYGLPSTSRSVGGHRRYRSGDLVQLSLMRDEIAIGRRAGDAARWVRGLLDEANPEIARIHAMLDASNRLDAAAIRSVLDRANAEIGLVATLDAVLLPAMRQVGAWWETGVCDVGQEHFTTELVRGWLAKEITLTPTPKAATTSVLLATGPDDFHTLGLEALAAQLAQQGLPSRPLGPRTSQRVLLAATAATPGAVVVVVSHLSTHRRSAVASLVAVAETSTPTFYAGNAFMFPGARKGVPGTYLGETIGEAALLIAAAGQSRCTSESGQR
jgi:MerR family transcriptional regulator, light-induced transcriptional regulator